MKKYNKAAALLVTLAAGFFSLQANAAQKIGVIDVQAVFQQLPQAAAIENTINAEFKDRIEEIQRLQNDIKYYMDKKQREGATLSEAQKNEIDGKIRELGTQYQEKAKPLDAELRRRKAEEQNRLVSMIKKSVDSIGEKENYDIILQSSAVVYLDDDANNLSQKVVDAVSKMK
ncbi:OmpH family outer membrane protein [Gayadomonas joobiniege]|uniref:OmpH family outer membrane protein n=1 Tax=Gayadomonas joobiniege TaxID=1234606 RepID=UPI00036088F3|nr:OmpH family outer membrane protein [Gayadomonas joobiniege]